MPALAQQGQTLALILGKLLQVLNSNLAPAEQIVDQLRSEFFRSQTLGNLLLFLYVFITVFSMKKSYFYA